MRALGCVFVAAMLAQPALAQPPSDARDPSITTSASFDPEKTKTMESYPQSARRNGVEGDTRVRMCIDVTGRVSSPQVAVSSGDKSLDEASPRWAQKSWFKPAKVGDTPVAVCNHELTYEWKLDARTRTIDYRQFHLLREADRPAMIEAGPTPEYPKIALEHRIAEKVPLSLCIGPEGTVDLVTIENLKGNGNLAVATVQWVMASKFKPGMYDGKPAGVCGLKVAYDWKLPD